MVETNPDGNMTASPSPSPRSPTHPGFDSGAIAQNRQRLVAPPDRQAAHVRATSIHGLYQAATRIIGVSLTYTWSPPDTFPIPLNTDHAIARHRLLMPLRATRSFDK